MQKTIVINADPRKRGRHHGGPGLVELLVERPDERRIVGDIYKGRINAVRRDAAAFVKIGLAKTASCTPRSLRLLLGGHRSPGGRRREAGGGRPREVPCRARPVRRKAAPAPSTTGSRAPIEDHLTKGRR